MILSRMLPVCSAENVSVEKIANTHSHSSVGSHASSLRGGVGADSVMTGDDKLALPYSSL